MNAKHIGIGLISISLILGGLQIRSLIVSNYRYEKDYSQYWHLSDKSSTISAKQEYLNKYLVALKQGYTNGMFAENNAIFLKTPNNSFLFNVKALETLVQRLTEIQDMDPSSFQYNTAISQITAQEQGQAAAMLDVFNGCYVLKNFPIIWEWIGITIFILCFFSLITGISMVVVWYDNYKS